MRLDHVAYRVKDRNKAALFFENVFGYEVRDEFLPFEDDSVKCFALVPSERRSLEYTGQPIVFKQNKFHLAPEIFISSGKPGSIVHDWVEKNGDGVHHLAYEVSEIELAIEHFKRNRINFLSKEILTCPGIKQIFTEPQFGIIFELIERTPNAGFCKDNVRQLMESTDGH